MTKVSVIGAGNVGATLAMRIAEAGLADVALFDIFEGIASGKAMDMTDASPVVGHARRITGIKDYREIDGSSIVVITAGFPRTPGMTREELLAKNASVVRQAAENIKRYCPGAIIIVITNPLDAMTYFAYKVSGFEKNRVIGMAGVLDASRFKALLELETGAPSESIETYILGSHGDTMVPLLSRTKIKGRPIDKVLSREKIAEIVNRVRNRGAEIVAALKTGSAYYAPSASAFAMVRAILKNTKEVICTSCVLSGEYGLKDICIGVPAKLGANGIEKIIQLDLSKEEAEAFKRSAEVIRETLGTL